MRFREDRTTANIFYSFAVLAVSRSSQYREDRKDREALRSPRVLGIIFAVTARTAKNFNFLFPVLAVSRSSRYREDPDTAKDFHYFLFGLRGLAVFAVLAGSGTDRQTFWSVGCRNIGHSVSGKLVYHQHFHFYQITRIFCVENESV